MISVLQNNGFEIARTTSKNISIKTDGKNLRLKGAFCDEYFRFRKELSADIRNRSAKYERSSQERYKTAREKLNRQLNKAKENITENIQAQQSTLIQAVR